VEIYNETIYDLLSENGSRQLQLREDSKRGIVFAEGAIEEEISNPSEALEVFWKGCSNRSVASTLLNRESSRSHAVFTLFINSERFQDSSTGLKDIRMSRFNLVDLAGSERQASTQTVGMRLKEAGNINRSLLALANVINALALADSRHAPYRDSKLTFLLRDSLGGNSKTAVIATVSPSFQCQGETLSTLRFAQRAKLVKNSPTLNQDVCGSVSELQSEILRLRNLVSSRQEMVQISMKSTEYDFNALVFSLKQLEKSNEHIRYLEEKQAALLEGQGQIEVSSVVALASENSFLKSKLTELESYDNVRSVLEFKTFIQELSHKIVEQEEAILQPIVPENQLQEKFILDEYERRINNYEAKLKTYENELFELKLRLSENIESKKIEIANWEKEKQTFETSLNQKESKFTQLRAEFGRKFEMLQLELDMERKGAEKLAAENAILKVSSLKENDQSKSLPKNSNFIFEDQKLIIEKLKGEIEELKIISSSKKSLEERIEFFSSSLRDMQAQKQSLEIELSTTKEQVKLYLDDIEELKKENDKLVQHNNLKQKLHYHVRVKQENNELREEVARLQNLLSKHQLSVS
jgi:kinesin family member 15